MARVSVLRHPFPTLKGIKMIKLNLTANSNGEQRIKDYLEQNVSETLAEKINNGVQIQKDNLTLLNKKDLAGCLDYAKDEAQKLVEKNAQYACIDDPTVFGWAVHYFEEDSIEGNLYHLDGTEYEPAVKEKPKTTAPKKVEPKPQDQQANIFDLLGEDIKMPAPIQPAKVEPVKVATVPVPKDNNHLSLLNEILGGIVKEL